MKTYGCKRFGIWSAGRRRLRGCGWEAGSGADCDSCHLACNDPKKEYTDDNTEVIESEAEASESAAMKSLAYESVLLMTVLHD